MDKGCRPKTTRRDGLVPWRPSITDLLATASSAIPADGRAPHPPACAISTTLTAQSRLHPAKPRPVASDDVPTNIALAWRVWNEGHDPRGTVDGAYLRRGKLALPEGLPSWVLKFNSAVGPGMVALLCAMATNEPCGLHQTVLDRDSSRLGRQMLGPAQHAVIKLDADEAVTLGLPFAGELETGLAARRAGLRPVWALASAGAVAGFPVLPAIKAISVQVALVSEPQFADDVADRRRELV
jgi:hypothetical protein